jgi:glutamyl-tRNA synthetase
MPATSVSIACSPALGPDVGGPYGPYRQVRQCSLHAFRRAQDTDYLQSERKELYAARVRQLLKAGKAYRCFCSPAELDAQQRLAYQRGEMAIYPGACLHISPEESEERAAKGDAYAVRFKTRKREVMFKDLVYGRYAKGSREGDFIIMKRDGYPTYHFANVVDDHLMKVSHVIRGAVSLRPAVKPEEAELTACQEWLISTPRHIELYGAFGWTPPEYAHVGLLVDRKRAKLSKRSPGIGLSWYRSNHVLPQAVLNFAVLLGWSTPRKKQVMTLDELADEVGNLAVPLSSHC